MLAVRIQAAITDMQDAIDCDDHKGILVSCAAVANLTAEQTALVVLDIRNKGE
jgi:predicted sulfurtransferase